MSSLDETKLRVRRNILGLWLALRDLSDFCVDEMCEEDLDLWVEVNNHPIIQEKLDNVNI